MWNGYFELSLLTLFAIHPLLEVYLQGIYILWYLARSFHYITKASYHNDRHFGHNLFDIISQFISTHIWHCFIRYY